MRGEEQTHIRSCRGNLLDLIQVSVAEAANPQNLGATRQLVVASRFDWEGEGEHIVKYTEEAEYL